MPIIEVPARLLRAGRIGSIVRTVRNFLLFRWIENFKLFRAEPSIPLNNVSWTYRWKVLLVSWPPTSSHTPVPLKGNDSIPRAVNNYPPCWQYPDPFLEKESVNRNYEWSGPTQGLFTANENFSRSGSFPLWYFFDSWFLFVPSIESAQKNRVTPRAADKSFGIYITVKGKSTGAINSDCDK